jgi:hypothetical protein
MEMLANSPAPRNSGDSLLQYNITKGQFQTAPFFRGYFDDFLPPAEYRRMAQAFPGPDYFIHKQGKYGKTVFKSGSAFSDFVSENPQWQDFFGLFASRKFIADMRACLSDGIAKARPDIADKKWAIVDSPLQATNGDYPVKMTVEFSRLYNGDYLEPHTDNPDKIISLLFYFADDEWKQEYGGGTDFYAPKFNRLNNNWENRYMNYGAMRRVWSPGYVANRLAVFVKDRNSWHGISPLKIPQGVSRKALLVNYQTFTDKVHAATLRSKSRFFDLRALYRLQEALTGSLSSPSPEKL